MGKRRCFLGIFTSLLMIVFAGSAFAEGYSCPAYKKYTSCSANYYLNGTDAGNACLQCNSGYTAPANNTGGATSCTQTCTVNCTKPTCPTNATCTYGSETASGTRNQTQASGVCSATAPACSMTVSCNASYYKNNSGTCSSCDIGTYSTGGTTSCSACTNKPANSSYTGNASSNSCPWTCNSGYHKNAAGTACEPDCSTSRSCSADFPGYTGTYDQCAGNQTSKCTKACSGNNTSGCPANATCTYNTSYTYNYPSSGTCPVSGFSCNANFYKNGSGCTGCDSGYSSPAGSTSASQCSRSCTKACSGNDTANCPANATCTYDTSKTSSGTQVQGGTCNASTILCPVKTSSCKPDFYPNGTGGCEKCPANAICNGPDPFTCKSGYTKSGSSCVANKYTITLNANGGSGGTASVTGTYDSMLPTLSSLPTRATYTFVGYYDTSAATGGNQYYNSQGTGIKLWDKTSNTTLYARWSQNVEACQTGKYYNGSSHVACPAGKYCPGVGNTPQGTAGCAVSCDAGYTSAAGASAPESCTKSCEVACTSPSCPANSQSCTFDTTYKATGTMNQVSKTCSVSSPACPVKTISCKSSYYAKSGSGTYTCDSCENLPGGYTLSILGAATQAAGPKACYKSCRNNCTKPTCNTANATCSYSTETYGGGAYYGGDGTCTAIEQIKACSITGFTCNDGYYKSSDNTCKTCPANATCSGVGNDIKCNAGFSLNGEVCVANDTQCVAGKYYNGTAHVDCPAGKYCPGVGTSPVGTAGCVSDCPSGGTSAIGAKAKTQCYKTCPAPGTDAHGTITYASPVQSDGKAYIQSDTATTYPSCVYSITCTEEGYIPSNSPGANPTCIWDTGATCPVGYYCPPEGGKFQCPDSGTSDLGAAESANDCYKIFDPYSEFENGVASAKCKYLTTTKKYENCSILEVKSCKAGYWYSTPGAFLCSGVSSGFYSPEGATTATACPADASGTVESTEYAASFTNCYKTCAITVPHSTSVAAKDNIVYGKDANSYNACSFAITCESGYTAKNNNTANPSCAANQYTITLNKNGGTGSVAASVQCTFDSGACALPATTGMTRAGYTVAAKWCSTAAGGTPCYDAGTTITTNISPNGTDTTLYAVWTPNVYTINLDHQSAKVAGAPATVYLKYATGWYSNANATTAISKLTTLPTKDGYIFTGYYNQKTGGTQVIGSDGGFIKSDAALKMTTTNPTTIYARWAAGSTHCDAGTYYTGTATTCAQCTANNYCPGGDFETDSGHNDGLIACTDSGASLAGAKDSSACYKLNLPYTASHGSGTQRCYYNAKEDKYNDRCDTRKINLCNAGYWLKNASDTDCVAVGIGHYSDGTSTTYETCPNNGLTEEETSTKIQDCFLTGLPYTAVYGAGTQRCFYTSGTGASAVYQRDCDTKRITSCRGGYWRPTPESEDCDKVGQGNYSPAGDIARHACEDGGDTRGENAETSDSAKLCFKSGQEYIGEHGTGNRICFYTSGTGASAIYSSSCDDPNLTYCDAGYYYDANKNKFDCIVAGMGWFSPAADTEHHECPNGGKTKTTTSASISECYLEELDCAITNGAGQWTCNYDDAKKTYSASCTTCTVVGCDSGFSQVGNTCVKCPAGSVCTGGEQKTCSSLTDGKYPLSDLGTTDAAMCYKDCALGTNAAAMGGRDYYKAPDTCKIVRCKAGYKLSDGVCTLCPAGSFCDGTTDPENPGDDITSCADLGDGSWEFSVAGATDAKGCYRKCEEYRVENGTAIPINDKEFYPNQCQYKGISDTGNPCDITDGVCIETSCNNNYEMINGSCKPCNRENALSYKPNGNCVIASCITGYHPNGQVCEEDIKECTVPNAVYAEHKWDTKLNAFGTCIVKECEDGFHLASNACVSDVQPCTVENGTGFKEWNHATNNWGSCEATSCDPGYTNDPTETNERAKQCGQCKNKFSVLGELAASSYVRGCEIASCMYQGELYNLENNECVPICDVNGYEDETGTMKWDPVRKKCVRTCKEGYTMW